MRLVRRVRSRQLLKLPELTGAAKIGLLGVGGGSLLTGRAQPDYYLRPRNCPAIIGMRDDFEMRAV